MFTNMFSIFTKWFLFEKLFSSPDIQTVNIDSNKASVKISWYNQKQPPEVFYENCVLKKFSIFTGKHLCWSLFLIKLQVY